jgi:hypothetical protein
MAKVIISVDNNIVANSIAIWFESGDAVNSWKDWAEDTIEDIREDGTFVPEIEEYATVDFGDPEDWAGMVHKVSLYEE